MVVRSAPAKIAVKKAAPKAITAAQKKKLTEAVALEAQPKKSKDLATDAPPSKDIPLGLKGKMPKSLAECADLLYTKKQLRLEAARGLKVLEAEERWLTEHIINTLPKSQAEGVVGKLCRVTREEKTKPIVTDWAAFYAHIKKTGQFELLQRRLGEGAVQERWDAKKTVPGVDPFTVLSLSVTKR
jgi:hypothetical protein